ncbi:MAG: hypothetical protein KGZ37_10280 [Nitrosarchaeum sp.]|nr:hypothetical protein [Nitrosarchaeum sp.]
MSDLVQCTRCNKKLMNEEYENHVCMPQIKSFKTVKFTDYYITKNEDVTRIHVITQAGLDLELIEIPENKKFTKIPYQPRGNTENTSTDKVTEPFYGYCCVDG